MIVADLDEQPEGGEATKRERVVLEVGGSGNPEAFNKQIVGARHGRSYAFDIDYPAEHSNPELAGKKVGYRIARPRGQTERDPAARRRAGQETWVSSTASLR